MKNYEVMFNNREEIEQISRLGDDGLLIELFTCNKGSTITSLNDHLIQIVKDYKYTYYYLYDVNMTLHEAVKYISNIHNKRDGE